METLQNKKQFLKQYLRELDSVAIAFSGGVDSTFLLKMAHDVLGNKAIALTAKSGFFPQRESSEAEGFCRAEGIEQIFVQVDELSNPDIQKNPANRCYLCKYQLFQNFLQIAAEKGIPYVAEGSNLDDNGDYRPGLLAVAELNIKSPLREANLSKEDIRELSRELNLPTWKKPSFACLATRFAYGETISAEKLMMVEKAEQKLFDLGFQQFRVRIHENIARIEIPQNDFPKIMQQQNLKQINSYFHDLGFLYVTLDLEGYQMGSMNKLLYL